jgi:hypothetical protein
MGNKGRHNPSPCCTPNQEIYHHQPQQQAHGMAGDMPAADIEPAATAAIQHDAAVAVEVARSGRSLRPRGLPNRKSSSGRSRVNVVPSASTSRAQVRGQSSCSPRPSLRSSQSNEAGRKSQQHKEPQRTKKVREL